MKKIILALSVLISIINSCKKSEGEGGSSTVRGSVWVEKWNATYTVKEAEYAGMDEDVYIIYGSHTTYDDKTKTNANGEYAFKYLREGNYKIYMFSKDKSLQSASGKIAITKEVKVTDSDQTQTVEKITIYQ